MSESTKATVGVPQARVSKKKPSGFGAAYFNICNTIIGAGTLGLPLAFSRAGIALATVLLVIFCLLAQLASYHITYVADALCCYYYSDIASRLYGTKGTLVTALCISIGCIGFQWAYVILCCDFVIQILLTLGVPATSVFVSRWFMTVIFGICIFMPLSWFRRVTALQYASLGGFFGILFTIVCIVVRFFAPTTVIEKAPPEAVHASLSIIQCFSSLIFAFGCHPNIPTMLGELKQRNAHLMHKVTVIGFSSVAVLYFLCGLFGYLSFTSRFYDDSYNAGNILSLYPTNDYLMIVALFSTLLCVATSYPLQNIPARQALFVAIRVIYDLIKKPKHIKVDDMYPNNEVPPLVPKHYKNIVICCGITKHHLMTGITSTITTTILTVLSIFLYKVALVFDIMGSTTGAMVNFILPAFFYLHVKRHPYRFVNPNRKELMLEYEGNPSVEVTQEMEIQTNTDGTILDGEGSSHPAISSEIPPASLTGGLPHAARPVHQISIDGEEQGLGGWDSEIGTKTGRVDQSDPRVHSRMGLLAAQSPMPMGTLSTQPINEEMETEAQDPSTEPVVEHYSLVPIVESNLVEDKFHLPKNPENDDRFQKRTRRLLKTVRMTEIHICGAALMVVGGALFGLISLAMGIIYNTDLKKFMPS
ncbi:Transmembrane amino acid transporter [Blattamonas nauphoetae]|uniref:Transmembrane amino acid transporter n=1 Tax=Blattamonas nauphoetae TaxID=2049346 RepID=A0ABQ9XAL0_9EUKA|nr:Transmembrane amino acid transporter [Blattamonas nauphoetae]